MRSPVVAVLERRCKDPGADVLFSNGAERTTAEVPDLRCLGARLSVPQSRDCAKYRCSSPKAGDVLC